MDLFVTRFIEKKLGYVTSILMGHPKKKKKMKIKANKYLANLFNCSS